MSPFIGASPRIYYGQQMKYKEEKVMSNMYITIAGTQFRYGSEFLEKGMTVKLIKEPDNEYDKEAIRVELKPIGAIGYVANSVKTVIGTCSSAGRVYDHIGDTAKAEILYVTDRGVIAFIMVPDDCPAGVPEDD